VQQHDRHTWSAGVPVPETSVGNLRQAVFGWNLGGNRNRCHRIGDRLTVCHLDTAFSHYYQAGSESDDPEQSAQSPDGLAEMFFFHCHASLLPYAHFLKETTLVHTRREERLRSELTAGYVYC